jgi:hypothetical protein
MEAARWPGGLSAETPRPSEPTVPPDAGQIWARSRPFLTSTTSPP